MFVSKSWPGQQGLGRPLVGTGQSVKGVSEAGGLTTHSCWESSGRELESNPPGWRPLEERRSRPGTRSQGPPRSQGTGESPQRAFLWEGVWFLLLHGDLSIGVVTPQSMQVGSERGCLLRAVLIKLSLVWFLPRTDASQRVHRTCLWRVSPMGLRASPPTTVSPQISPHFLFCRQRSCTSRLQEFTRTEAVRAPTSATLLRTQQILSKWYWIASYNY